MERASRAHSETKRHEGARSWSVAELLRGRHNRLRWAARHHAGWADPIPVRDRQPRHRVGDGCASRRCRGPGCSVGKVRHHLGRHGEELALHVCLRWQPNDARDDAGRLRNGNGCEEKTSGDRSQKSWWQAGKLRGRERARLPQRRRRGHDVGAGRSESNSTGRYLRRPRTVG